MKVAFFDSKPYDEEFFRPYENESLKMKFFETKLNEDTVSLASGYDVVCVFVNDTINAAVIDKLHAFGIKLIALRCAGYNHVDLKHANGKIGIVRVPAYSPYAVAEYTIALLLTLVRNTHKAYVRTKSFNFSLNGLLVFDLKGKTVGVTDYKAQIFFCDMYNQSPAGAITIAKRTTNDERILFSKPLLL